MSNEKVQQAPKYETFSAQFEHGILLKFEAKRGTKIIKRPGIIKEFQGSDYIVLVWTDDKSISFVRSFEIDEIHLDSKEVKEYVG